MSYLEYEEKAVELEAAEYLINVYWDFIESECPLIEKEKSPSVGTVQKAISYADHTVIYHPVLEAAFDKIRKVKNDLQAACEMERANGK